MRAGAALFAVLLVGLASAAAAEEYSAPKDPPRFTLTFTERIRQESQEQEAGSRDSTSTRRHGGRPGCAEIVDTF